MSILILKNIKCKKYIRFLLSVYFFNYFTFSISQTKNDSFTKEIGILTENDAYMMKEDDGYYTNGLKIYLNWKGKDSLKIHSVSVGQSIFNAQNGIYSYIEDIDRPVTAYLNFTYNQSRFIHKKDLLSWGISLGVIGPMALGKNAQIFLHDVFGMYDPGKQWEFQLNNSLGINGEIMWVKEFPLRSHLELQSIVKARGGFFFNDLELGTLFRLGRFNNNTHTAYWNTKLNSQDKFSRRELFFYFQPSVSVYAYNATIQGGMFRKNKGPVTGKLNPFLYSHSIGVIGSWNRISLDIAVNYKTKETPSQERTQWYGGFKLAYLLR